MHALTEYFDGLGSNIEPPTHRVVAASEAQEAVRTYLKGTDAFITTPPHSALAGSYARNTAVGDIKDVDILLRADAEYLHMSPAAVLGKLRVALTAMDGVTSAELRTQRRSVHVYLRDRDFHLDVVPAVAENGLGEQLLVPCKTQDEWVLSNPCGYAAKLSDLNALHGGKVIPIIKMLKHWRDHHMARMAPKSYWLECLVFGLFNGGEVQSAGKGWGELFRDTLVGLRNRCASAFDSDGAVPRVTDPCTGKVVTSKWERNHFEAFFHRVEDSIVWCDRALAEDDVEKAIDLWSAIFGEAFPPIKATDRARQWAAAMVSGGLYVSSTGQLVTSPTAGVSVIPVPKAKFHGGGASHAPFRFRRQRPPYVQQTLDMKRFFPQFSCDSKRGAFLIFTGHLRPTAASPSYRVRVKLHRDGTVRVRVLHPPLAARCSHRYLDGTLCLYYPPDYTWTGVESLAEVIIPLTAVWLGFYEVEQETGPPWLGPESPHRGPTAGKRFAA